MQSRRHSRPIGPFARMRRQRVDFQAHRRWLAALPRCLRVRPPGPRRPRCVWVCGCVINAPLFLCVDLNDNDATSSLRPALLLDLMHQEKHTPHDALELLEWLLLNLLEAGRAPERGLASLLDGRTAKPSVSRTALASLGEKFLPTVKARRSTKAPLPPPPASCPLPPTSPSVLSASASIVHVCSPKQQPLTVQPTSSSSLTPFHSLISTQQECLRCHHRTAYALTPCAVVQIRINMKPATNTTIAVSLKDALADAFASNLVFDARCDHCGDPTTTTTLAQRRSLERPPASLCLHVQRLEWANGQVYKDRRLIALESPLIKIAHRHYRLSAIVIHIGNGSDNGHFVTYRSDAKGDWFCCSDEIITPIEWARVSLSEAYLLFFDRVVV